MSTCSKVILLGRGLARAEPPGTRLTRVRFVSRPQGNHRSPCQERRRFGDASLHNPEDLLVFALSSCHCLSYLALAARARLVVLGYEDLTSGVMTLVEGKIRFREVTIRPRVWVAPGFGPRVRQAIAREGPQ